MSKIPGRLKDSVTQYRWCSWQFRKNPVIALALQVSNLQGASEPAGEEFIDHIVGKLNEQRCLLDVVSVDVPDAGADADARQTKNVNSDTLAQVLLPGMQRARTEQALEQAWCSSSERSAECDMLASRACIEMISLADTS